MEDINLVTIGEVDHGKSSVIGRLLADTNSLPSGKIESIKNMCQKQSKVFEYAYLLDALKEEQNQGITIDMARCFFKTKNRRVLLKDAPGHLEFLKNMVTGASMVDAAFLVIDAEQGIRKNTKRHSYLLSILGIKQVAVIINKMDLVDYNYELFNSIKEDCESYLMNINIKPLVYIPVSAQNGDNIAEKSLNMLWYSGLTVLETIDRFEVSKTHLELPFRMSVQDIYKFTSDNDNRRIVAGTVLTGKAKVGDDIVFYPSKKQSKIKTFEMFNTPITNEITPQKAVGFTLSDNIYIKRGEFIGLLNEKSPTVSNKIIVKLFWLGDEPLYCNRKYYIKILHNKVEATVINIIKTFDAENLQNKFNEKCVYKNHIAECELLLQNDIAFDSDIFESSRLVIVDNYEICGGGIIISDSEKLSRLTPTVGKVTYGDRCRLLNQKGQVIWFTGRSGSGKSTIAIEVEKQLNSLGVLTYRLDGDNIRTGLNSNLGFSEEDRGENIRRIAEVAKMFADSGVVVIVSTISPLIKIRKIAREILKDVPYTEFYVSATVDTCKKRDPKGLYKDYFTTNNTIDYEEDNESLIIDTEKLTLEEEATFVLKYYENINI